MTRERKMREVLEQWSRELARFVSCALDEFRPRAAERMEGFAVDLHPWNGVVVLAFLTAKEFEEEPSLADAREMAAWRFYDFTSDLSCSHPGLGSRMRELYETERGEKAKVADAFFVACAEAVASK